MHNGIIAFIMDSLPSGPMLLRIEIANTFPIIPLGSSPILIHQDGTEEELQGYDHLSLPSDLRLHLSHRDTHIFFDVAPIWHALEHGTLPLTHLCTHIGLPHKRTPPVVAPGTSKTWFGAEFISPFRDAAFTDLTRLFIDIFIHTIDVPHESISAFPFLMPHMRLATDRTSSIIGPYAFESIQRRKTTTYEGLGFSIRFGYVDMADNDSTYTYSPLGIYSRRKR